MHSEYDEMAVIDGLDEVPVEISSLTRKVRSGRLLFFSWGWMWLRGWGDGGRGQRVCFIHHNCTYIHLLLIIIIIILVFVVNISGDRFLFVDWRKITDE